MYTYSNNLLPSAINDLYVSNNDVHKYYTRQNIYFMLTSVTSMFMHKALETQVSVYGMLYSPKSMETFQYQNLKSHPKTIYKIIHLF